MNSILPSGVPRFNVAAITTNVKIESQSVIIGESAGRDLSSTVDNYYNTFVGYHAGQNTLESIDNIFVGADTGVTLYAGSNNILIGKELNSDILRSSYNAASVGYNNKISNNSIFLGSDNRSIGVKNTFLGTQNTVTGNNNIVLGNANSIVGNDTVFIGHNLNYKEEPFKLNIADTFMKYDDKIFIGLGGHLIATGLTNNSIANYMQNVTNLPAHSLYSKTGICSEKVVIQNPTSDTGNISLTCASTLNNSIEYVLPSLPTISGNNIALSLNSANEMVWKNISMNTDDLEQGSSNLFYNSALVYAQIETKLSERFDTLFENSYEKRIPNLSVDRLQNGNNNKMIVNNVYNADLTVSGKLFTNHLIVNKIEVLGYGNSEQFVGNSTYNQSEIMKTISDTSNNLISIINALSARLSELEKN